MTTETTRRSFLMPGAGAATTARIAAHCLVNARVVCRSCGDACPERAIRHRPRPGAPEFPEISAAACTGCGACVQACPVAAVALAPIGPAS